MIVVKIGDEEYKIGQFFKVSDGQHKDYLEYIIGMIMFGYDKKLYLRRRDTAGGNGMIMFDHMDPYRYLYGELGEFKAIERVSFHESPPDDNPHITY